MRVILALALTTSVLAIGAAPGRASSLTTQAPPRGLTANGRLVWNLDALLHDTFGNREIYVNYTSATRIGNFSTRFISDAQSRYYLYTFAAARHSQFRAVRPATAPRVFEGTAAGEIPLKLLGAYISCGNGRWLYERSGQGPEQWQINCLNKHGV